MIPWKTAGMYREKEENAPRGTQMLISYSGSPTPSPPTEEYPHSHLQWRGAHVLISYQDTPSPSPSTDVLPLCFCDLKQVLDTIQCPGLYGQVPGTHGPWGTAVCEFSNCIAVTRGCGDFLLGSCKLEKGLCRLCGTRARPQQTLECGLEAHTIMSAISVRVLESLLLSVLGTHWVQSQPRCLRLY